MGSFVDIDNMAGARYRHTATRLNNGKVLVTGGAGGFYSYGTYSADGGFDSAGTFSATGAELYQPWGFLRTLIRTWLATPTGKFWAWVFRNVFRTSIFSATGGMTAPRSYHTATLLQDGKVLIADGDGLNSAELYDPAAETFSPTTNNMTGVRDRHTATLLGDGKVLIAGGASKYYRSRAPSYMFHKTAVAL